MGLERERELQQGIVALEVGSSLADRRSGEHRRGLVQAL